MGCHSSKSMKKKIKEQQKKLDDMITLNEQLQIKILELQNQSVNNGLKLNNDVANDLKQLKNIIDVKFNQLEKKVDIMHKEFKTKIMASGIRPGTTDRNYGEKSVTIDLEGEIKVQEVKDPGAPWDILLQDTDNTPKKIPTMHQAGNEEIFEDNKSDNNKKFHERNHKNDINLNENHNHNNIRKDTKEKSIPNKDQVKTNEKHGINGEEHDVNAEEYDQIVDYRDIKMEFIDTDTKNNMGQPSIQSTFRDTKVSKQNHNIEELLEDKTIKKTLNHVKSIMFKKQINGERSQTIRTKVKNKHG